MAAETLRDKQCRFAVMVARLINHAVEQGYQVSLGEAWRSAEEAARQAQLNKGIRRSLHCDRLALDLNLFKDGAFLSTTENHRPLGEWWESIGGTWGGRFNDGNHYSLAHDGRR